MKEVMTVDAAKCELTPTGARLAEGLSMEDWARVGEGMARASRSLQWWIGDWLNYGVREYGDKRALAIDHAEVFGLSAETLRHAMWVSEKVVNRLTTLSWTHHREVADMPGREQGQWLKKAELEEWSVSELRQAIRAEAGEYSDARAIAVSKGPTRLLLDLNRWAKSEDVSQWPKERKEAVKRDLEPLVELWRKL